MWDKGSPAPGIKAKQLDNDVRTNNDALEAAIDNEHDFATSGTQTGDHTQGSARCFFNDTAPATRIDGSSFIETDNGSLWIDTDDDAFYIMTDYSEVVAADKWTPVSTEVITTLLASGRVFLDTLGVTGDFAVNTDKFTIDAATGNVAVAGTLDIQSSTPIDSVIDDDAMATATNTNVATSESIKAYIDTQLSFSEYTTTDSDLDTIVKSTTYTATGDGFVVAMVKLSGTNDLLEGQLGGTAIIRHEVAGNDWASISYPVASGETFRVTASTGTPTIRWKSRGPLSRPTK